MKTNIMMLLVATCILPFTKLEGNSSIKSDTLEIWVNGLCGMCKTRIEEAAMGTRGVEDAAWNADNKLLTIRIRPDRLKTDRLLYRVASAGHDTEEYRAPDPVYDALPGCCKYRDFDSHDDAKLASAGISDKEGELDMNLEEVSVVHRRRSSTASFSSTYKVINIHEKELTKAACCNLSESFETNPSVDAGFTDAVTGTRKIEMLGLAGPYVQITRENIPDVRGLSALSGLSHSPGTWIESMQLNMGAGSVVNGFESISGQINMELRKPGAGDRLFLNTYANSEGKMELNAVGSYNAGERLKGSLLFHGSSMPFYSDHNGDGFKDHPTGNTLVFMKRLRYANESGFESQLGIRALGSDMLGGQPGFERTMPPDQQEFWGSHMRTGRLELWGKAGKVFQDRPYSSVGLQFSGVLHGLDTQFGMRNYEGRQQSLYTNLIYQSILGSTDHQYRAGLSLQADNYKEVLLLNRYDRREWVPGTFLEYTYNHMDRFTLVAGLRADYHNNFGFFLTPRLHLRMEPIPRTVIRASAGRGQKTASVFAENMGVLASSREFVLAGSDEDTPYGLNPETAWTFGLNFQQGFYLGQRSGVFQADYYHTRFLSQVVVDLEDPGRVRFYNLEGISRSNSLQLMAEIEAMEGFDIRLAYRMNDPRITYGDRLLLRPLTP